MLFHALPGFFRLSVVRDIGSGGMQPGAHIIDPDTRLGAEQEVGGQEADLGKLFFQVFVYDRRFLNHAVAVDQHRHLAVGISLHQVGGFIF